MPTVKGYWRAPSIQASLYDDSAHSTDGNSNFNEGLELEKIPMAVAPTKISTNYNINSNSEVRI